MGGACSTYGMRRGVYIVVVGKPRGMRSLGGLRLSWEDNITMVFRKWDWERGWNGLIWLRVRRGGGQL